MCEPGFKSRFKPINHVAFNISVNSTSYSTFGATKKDPFVAPQTLGEVGIYVMLYNTKTNSVLVKARLKMHYKGLPYFASSSPTLWPPIPPFLLPQAYCCHTLPFQQQSFAFTFPSVVDPMPLF